MSKQPPKAIREPGENKWTCGNCGESLVVKVTSTQHTENSCLNCGYEWPHNLPLRVAKLERQVKDLLKANRHKGLGL